MRRNGYLLKDKKLYSYLIPYTKVYSTDDEFKGVINKLFIEK